MKTEQILLVLLIFATSFSLPAQETYEAKPLVVHATYYDKTPPLRDMQIILPGERKREWKDNIIQNKSFKDSIKNQRMDIPEGFVDPVLQQNYGRQDSRNVRGPIRSFDGVGNVNSVYPPDTDGDVGPNHYFQMINLSFAIWDKEGNKLYGPVDNSTLWAGFIGPWTSTNDGDPIILYDEGADRWMASQFAINTPNNTHWQLVAVSETSDPLGAYHRYAFQMTAFNDYPKMGVWPDAYYATFNMFGGYVRASVAAFERDSMLVGAPARMVYYDQSSSKFSMLPADFDGTPPPSGAPCYFAHLNTYTNQNLEIFEFDVDWTDPNNSSFSMVNTLNTASFSPNTGGVPQPGTGTELDALQQMLMFRLQYRNFGTHEVLLANHTVNAGGREGVRWYEVRKDAADWYIYQQGTYSPDSESRWMGSIAMNGNGDIAIGYSKSSSSTHPSVCYTARYADDPPGEMTIEEIMVKEGTSSQSGVSRWGDYACLSVDPEDDSTFWFTTEYRGNGWKTRIASFDLGALQDPDVDAGPDTLICENELFEAQPIITGAASVFWETAGDGMFLDPTQINALYLRGQQDVENGEVMLSVSAYGYGSGTESQDSLNLSISLAPYASAGSDTTIKANETVILNGYAENYDTIYWTTDGDGMFDDSLIMNAVYTPGAEDIEKGGVGLWFHAIGFETCQDEDEDRMVLSIDELTFIFEKPADDDARLSIVPNPANDKFTFTLSGIRGDWAKIYLYNIQGQTLFTQELTGLTDEYSNTINLGYLKNGTYLLRAVTTTGTITEKVLVY